MWPLADLSAVLLAFGDIRRYLRRPLSPQLAVCLWLLQSLVNIQHGAYHIKADCYGSRGAEPVSVSFR